MQTLLVDLHLAFGNLADHLDLSPIPYSTANLALMAPEAISEQALKQCLITHDCGVKVLASSPIVPVDVTFSPEHLAAIVDQSAFSAQYTLLDLPTDPDVVESVAHTLDGITLVLGSEPASLRTAQNIAAHLNDLRLLDRLSILLIHRCAGDQPYLSEAMVIERLGCPLLGALPAKPEPYLRAEHNRVPLMLNGYTESDRATFEKIGNKLSNYVAVVEQFHRRPPSSVNQMN